jgi:hypothetical protein
MKMDKPHFFFLSRAENDFLKLKGQGPFKFPLKLWEQWWHIGSSGGSLVATPDC